VENYFTDSLLYQENNKPVKKPLPDDIDSGNEADSESEEDAQATFSMEPIVAYLDEPDCNNPAENENEWVLLLLITLCVLRMYLNLSILVPCTCLCPSRKWHACIRGQ